MTDNRIMKLWTAIVTAFLALCTALGLITTTATTAVARTEPTRSSETGATAHTTAWPPTSSAWLWAQDRSLPPTMKQRIHAEAHGKSPSCRHRGLPDTESAEHTTATCDPANPAEQAEPAVPLQR
ncbi:hypothetical protein SAMN04487983_102523 [Streptomyces sp. yr375]|uniref:DUF6344 domain-containing protein n=1 Tax=Streptomyces sp. yr375 TaxID=1761906 RepID=UPI0008BCDFCE|nr:DUF6344 domain-containing protein [Streptomyces sp. yr375]SER92227.1 hypothetical protein SAMN04487983_102523 [Streptomyces sp. yr375]